jgi:hypothetical protein
VPKATTKRKATKKKFPGILDRPMIWRDLPPSYVSVLGRPSDEELLAERRDQLASRLAALFAHYEVDRASPDAWHALALRLAQDFVRGFQIRSIPSRGRGKTEKWDIVRRVRLLGDVASFTRRGFTVGNACRMLTKQKKFAARYRGENFTSLARRYREARKIVRSHAILGKLVARAEARVEVRGRSMDAWFFAVFWEKSGE